MSFSSKLGTSSVRLSSIKLATAGTVAGGGDVSLSIDGRASISVATDYVFTAQLGIYRSQPEFLSLGYGSLRATNVNDSLTIAGQASLDITPNLVINCSASTSVTASASATVGLAYTNSITLNATSATGLQFEWVVPFSMSVTSAVALASQLAAAGSVTLTVTDSVTIASTAVMSVSKTLNMTSSALVVANQTYEHQHEILGASAVVLLPGIGYSDTITLSGIASADDSFSITKTGTLALDATSSLDTADTVDWKPTATIAGVASFTPTHTGDWLSTVSVDAISTIYVEGYYNFLMVTARGELTPVNGSNFIGDENPSGVSGIGVTAEVIFNRTISQTLALTQTAHIGNPVAAPSQTFTVTQSAVTRNVFNRTIVHNLVINQVMYRLQTASNTLTISAQVTTTYAYVRPVTQTLAMTQAVTKTSVVSRSASNTLVMRQGFNRPLPFSVQSGQLQVTVPAAYVAVISERCYMTLGVPARSIVLPCPRLGDSQNYSGQVTLQRTMTGDTTTYVRKSRFNKLKYTWWLGRQKVLELQDFVLNFSADIITLYNWKGETWIANMLTNPIEFSPKERYQPLGERYEVSIEFEGVKIGG